MLWLTGQQAEDGSFKNYPKGSYTAKYIKLKELAVLKAINGTLKYKAKNGFYIKATDRHILVEALEAFGWDYVFTFNTYQFVSEDNMALLLIEFEKRLNKRLFGRGTNLTLQWVHFYEYDSGNAHAHSLVDVSSSGADKTKFKRHCRHIWAELTTLWLTEKTHTKPTIYIDTGTRNSKAATANYISKQGTFIG